MFKAILCYGEKEQETIMLPDAAKARKAVLDQILGKGWIRSEVNDITTLYYNPNNMPPERYNCFASYADHNEIYGKAILECEDTDEL